MRYIPRQQFAAARRVPGEFEVLPQVDAVGFDRVRGQPLPKLTGGQVFCRQSSHIHSETSVFIFAGFIMDWRGGLVNVCDWQLVIWTFCGIILLKIHAWYLRAKLN